MATYTVKKGDNLTHIARRFGIGSWRELYNHPRNAEFKRKRPNPNLIFPGDLLFIPGDEPGPQVIDLGETRIVVPLEDKKIEDMTEEERDQALALVKDSLPPDLKGEAEGILKWVGLGLTFGQLATLIPNVSMGAGAMAGPAVLAVRLVLGWMSAWETNEKMYGFRACAYTVTAWAFGKPRPKSSPEMMRRFKQFSSIHIIRERDKAWQEASLKTWRGLNAEYVKQGVEKAVWQAAYKLVGIQNKSHSGSPPQKLCHAMLKEFEGQFRGVNLASWKEGYRVLYPK